MTNKQLNQQLLNIIIKQAEIVSEMANYIANQDRRIYLMEELLYDGHVQLKGDSNDRLLQL